VLETLKQELAASKQELQVLQGTLETTIQVRDPWPHCRHPAAVSEPRPRPLLRPRWDSAFISTPSSRGAGLPFLVVSVLWQGKALPTKVPLG